MSKRKHQSIVYNADGVEFTIYQTIKPTKAGPRVYWLLEDYTTGKRRLLNNKTLRAAQQRADKIRAAMVKGQANRFALSEGAWQDMCVAREAVLSMGGGSLSAAAQEWADCTLRLGGKVSLLEAVQFYVTHYADGGSSPQPTGFVEAAEQYHQFKLDAGKSKGHCKNIRSELDRLLSALPPGVRLDQLTAGQLDAVVVGFGLKEKTRNEYRIMLSSLYSWAAKQNPPLVPKGFNPAQDMERHKVKHQEVEFLRAADLRKILVAAPTKRPDLVPLIVLVCFAGLRPSEAVRLDWSEVGADYIRLPGKKSKTGYSRQIPIQDNLKAWLALWRKNEGSICPGIDLPHLNVAIRHFLGVRLSHDAMRHGYGTHRQKVLKNVGAVADEMGNSPVVCRRHYLNALCSEQEAAEWFSIMPVAAANIIHMPSAAGVPSAVAGANAI
jgi:integrase